MLVFFTPAPPGGPPVESDIATVGRALLQKGIDIEADFGHAPLIMETVRGHSEILQMLLDAGADIHKPKDNFGHTPLIAAAASHSEIVNILLNAEANIEAKNDGRHTPLMAAARNRHSAVVVQILLNAGANIEAKNDFGDTPLLMAAEAKETPTPLSNALSQHGVLNDVAQQRQQNVGPVNDGGDAVNQGSVNQDAGPKL